MSGPTTVTVTREIAASPERVFAIWTDPDAMMRWFGIEGMTNLEAGFEPRVGGAWFSKARDPGGAEFRMAGTVTVFEPGRRLGQTWAYVDAEGVRGNETEVEVILEAAPKGCRVTVNHRRILYTPDAFREGWGQSLDRIERMVA